MKRMLHTNCLLATLCLLTWLVLSTTAGGAAWAQTRLYVDDDAPCPGDGLSWATAFCDLRDARDYAWAHPEVEEIRVAHGTYYPDRGTGIRAETFELLSNLAFRGGYRGLTACDPNDPNEPNDPNYHNIDACETILSGEIGNPDVTTDNSYHVVTGTGTDATAIIDGFTITAGRADGSNPHNNGAGLINLGGSPLIANCTFVDNYATNAGAGMIYLGQGTDFVLSGCAFVDNTCGSSAAGADMEDFGAVTVTNCEFSGNSAAGNVAGGLGIWIADEVTVTGCIFRNNTAPHQGGGLRVRDGVLHLTDCVFDNNAVSTTSADQGRGGGVQCFDEVTAENCTFTNNSAYGTGSYTHNSGRGGAVYAVASLHLSDCTFTDNVAGADGYGADSKGLAGAVFANSLVASDCTFSGNLAWAAGTGTDWSGRGGAIHAGIAELIDCTLSENAAEFYSNYAYWSDAHGGAVNCWTSLNAVRCEFVGNWTWHAGDSGAYGGSVYARSVTLESCSFTANSAYGNGSNDGYGGAVYTDDNSTVATDCQFEGNSADHQGGAIYSYDANDTITDCTFIANEAVGAGGGAIHRYTDGEDPGRASKCLFLNNVCGGQGGAIRNETSTFNLDHCDFEGNAAASNGGAVCHDGISQSIVDCSFVNNTAAMDGGAILLDDGPDEEGCSPWIVNCRFQGNAAVGCGGALACFDGSSPTVVNSLLTCNQADMGGGAVYSYYSAPNLADSTFYSNAAAVLGGALYHESSQVSVANCILWNDSPGEVYPLSAQVDINCSDIEGGWPLGQGNINVDPLFVDAACPSGDFHLGAGSPCIDAGCNTLVPEDEVDLDKDLDTGERTPLDLDLIRRFSDRPDTVDTGVADPPDYPLVVDMGAYEYGLFGDIDGDCDVDLCDLTELLANYGQQNVGYDHGDLNVDGMVNLADLTALLANYGLTCP
jgi:predicted outer membrane repeat protein